MPQSIQYRSSPHKIALVGNHLPRQCGIATFTTDLLGALTMEGQEADCWAMVMNDIPEGYEYPARVRFELNQKLLTDYRLAADFLNINMVEAVCLQHEFGIFGGEQGSHVLELLAGVRMPVITTLHTVTKEPSDSQRKVMKRVAELSDRLVVMSRHARETLREVYGIPEDKTLFVHHGIPDVPFVDPNYYKDQFGVEGKRVILTFGLLSPNKGIEYMIDALPEVVRSFPDTVYIVVGATHPHVRREQGESYRLSLQRRARDLGVSEHIIFHNRFVELKELCEFIGAADVYVTPYLNREQIVSGTLAYALGAGKATVSTPYWYAEEMLDEGRGRLVPFQDCEALSAEVVDLFRNEVERHAMRKRAYTYCREMIWKEVARRYLDIFAEAIRERERAPGPVLRARTLKQTPLEMPQPKLDHLIRMTDNVGMLQHAKSIVPDRYHGYCTDDNARALIAVLMAKELIPDNGRLFDLACIYLGFLHHAFNEQTGRFRNFMGYDRTWLEEQGSEDSHGRAIWGLGEAVALAPAERISGVAVHIFEKALPALLEFNSLRAQAFAIAGIHAYLRRFSGDSEVRRIREKLAERLFSFYQENAADDWPWIEDVITYANGKISQALIMSGQWLQRGEMVDAGMKSLKWLMQIQTDPNGHFVPIGNHGWMTRDGHRARFDQQPIEALNVIEACREAFNMTGERKWMDYAQRCMDWFLGQNDLNVPLYDYKTGGCCDGLTADGANHNQGAESTLAWLLSLLNLYSMRSSELSEIELESD